MTFVDTSRHLAGAVFIGRIVRAGYTALDALVAWNDARVTRKALSKLTAHELDDIGLCRADIDAIAEATARRF